MNTDIKKIGYWSSLLACLGASTYTVAQIFSPPLIPFFKFPWNELFIVVPSIILSISFVVAISCLHAITPAEKKFWSQISLSFAVMYSTIVSSVYILQLATVIPGTLQGKGAEVAIYSIVKSQPVQAIDGLGYAFLGLSTLFAFPIFSRKGVEGRTRQFLKYHGLLAPFSVIPLWIPPMIVVSMIWFITAPVATYYLAQYFKEA